MVHKKILESFQKYKKHKDFGKLSVDLHEKNKGKLEINTKVSLNNVNDLSIAYSPGVAQPCLEIVKDPSRARDLTINGKTIAIITDGSAVLGLGNIGPKASLPVMEGKAALFKKFANLNSFPLALDTQDVDEFIKTVKLLEPSFGGINLEDIGAPRCFEIEKRLKSELKIPVFHDDQHGTAIVTLAGLINSLQITNRSKRTTKIVINGAGAAGISIAKLLYRYGFREIVVCDRKGIISRHRKDLVKQKLKLKLLTYTNPHDNLGTLKDALRGSDVFIGVSSSNVINEKDVRTMAKDPIIFALANPNPEITPELAKLGGAKIIATGRSDYPNQINNVLAFPGIFKGVIEANYSKISVSMKLRTAEVLAEMVKKPNVGKIIPNPFDKGIAENISKAIVKIVEEKRNKKKSN